MDIDIPRRYDLKPFYFSNSLPSISHTTNAGCLLTPCITRNYGNRIDIFMALEPTGARALDLHALRKC